MFGMGTGVILRVWPPTKGRQTGFGPAAHVLVHKCLARFRANKPNSYLNDQIKTGRACHSATAEHNFLCDDDR